MNDLYWDTNGTADGTGAVAGTWGSSNFWNSDPLGIANSFQISTDATNDVHFSAGSNGAAGTITVSGTQLAHGIYFEEGGVTLSGGTLSLADGAIINNTTGGLPTIASALYATGKVSLTGTRIWLNNSSFGGGGTLEVSTSNATLVNNSAALNGLGVINVLSGGIDIRVNTGGATGYDYAAGTKLNFINSAALNTNMSQTGTWLGNIVIASGKAANINAANGSSTFIIAGSISGAGSVTVGGSGTLKLAAANTHTGNTAVTSGSLLVAHSLALQNSTLTVGSTSVTFDSSVASHVFRIGALGSSINLALEDNGGSAITLILGGNNTTQTYTAAFTGTGALTKIGTGQFILGGTNTYTGATTVNGGELRTDFSIAGAPQYNIISSSSALILGGGMYTERQLVNTNPNGQTFNGLTVKAGSSVVNQIRAGAGVLLLTLGSVTRETGGTAAFSANGSGTSGLAATGTNTASGIIGGWATYLTTNGGATATNTTDWATYSGGKIVALSSGSYTNTAATTAATNLDLTASVALNAGVTVGSVRFNNAIASPTLTLNGSHVVDSGGILVTPNVGANASRITGGSLTSGNGQDLVIIQNNTNASGALTVDAEITGAIGLTKSGGGQLILSGTNSYTGDTHLNGGVTTISSNADLGSAAAGAAVHLNGGTLSASASVDLDNAGANARNIVLESNGGTLDVASGQTVTVRGTVSGEGNLSLTGGGNVIMAGTASTQTGTTTVTAANLQVGVGGTGQTGPGAVSLSGASAVLSGSGVVQGTVTVNSGIIRAGDSGGASVGTLTTGDLIFTPASSSTVAEFQITGSAGAGTLASDRINITGSLTLNGSSNLVVDGTGYTPTLGDTFILLDWSTVLDTSVSTASPFSTGTGYRSGANIGNEGNLDLPDLSSYGLGWDVQNFSGAGSLTIVVVPEPGRMLLSFLGLALLALRRRRC